MVQAVKFDQLEPWEVSIIRLIGLKKVPISYEALYYGPYAT